MTEPTGLLLPEYVPHPFGIFDLLRRPPTLNSHVITLLALKEE